MAIEAVQQANYIREVGALNHRIRIAFGQLARLAEGDALPRDRCLGEGALDHPDTGRGTERFAQSQGHGIDVEDRSIVGGSCIDCLSCPAATVEHGAGRLRREARTIRWRDVRSRYRGRYREAGTEGLGNAEALQAQRSEVS